MIEYKSPKISKRAKEILERDKKVMFGAHTRTDEIPLVVDHARGARVTDVDGKEYLDFGAGWNQGDQIRFVIISERPSYWQMNSYDTYTGQGWTSNAATQNYLEAETSWVNDEMPISQETMQYAVATEINTDVLFNNGGFISSDIQVHVNTSPAGDFRSITALRILSPGETWTLGCGQR